MGNGAVSTIAPSLYSKAWAKLLVYSVAILVVTCAVATVVMVVAAYRRRDRDMIIVLASAWSVLPPAWFWADYFLVFRRGGNPEQFEQFKHGQQVSAAIWASIALTLAALASSDALKPPTP